MIRLLAGISVVSSSQAANWTPPGFENSGSFCYRNAVMQVLFRLPGLDFCQVKVNDLSSLLCSLQTEALQITTPPKSLDLREVNTSVGRTQKEFNTASQQDSADFFRVLQGALSEELLSSLGTAASASAGFQYFDFNPVTRLYLQCIPTETVTCTKTDLFPSDARNVNTLDLSFPAELNTEPARLVTLEDLLDLHFGELLLSKYGETKLPHKAWPIIETYPEYAALVVKRFASVSEKNVRLPHWVEFPRDRLLLNRNRDGGPTYRLVGYVNHSGSLDSGHYTSVAKQRDQWFAFDDTRVTRTEVNKRVISQGVYMLFYARN